MLEGGSLSTLLNNFQGEKVALILNELHLSEEQKLVDKYLNFDIK